MDTSPRYPQFPMMIVAWREGAARLCTFLPFSLPEAGSSGGGSGCYTSNEIAVIWASRTF